MGRPYKRAGKAHSSLCSGKLKPGQVATLGGSAPVSAPHPGHTCSASQHSPGFGTHRLRGVLLQEGDHILLRQIVAAKLLVAPLSARFLGCPSHDTCFAFALLSSETLSMD